MIRRFFHGMAFGAGFTIAAILIVYLLESSSLMKEQEEIAALRSAHDEIVEDFSNLSPGEKARMSSVIFVVRYFPSSEGRFIAEVDEVLKVANGIKFPHKPGDSFPGANYQADSVSGYGSHGLVMMVGEKPRLRTVSYFDGVRIGSFGNITLDEFRELVSSLEE
ncbi:hypothetical protein [Parahaliea aestuarii]|uniref:Uncharacterized protein n=1 Tax=Parahaliea aestuarii TaxID=1852021 RepID=A0A5C8ZZ53_9GAMM|nr:hypothetical protein [Parahaliea aestuarii]TXS93089.1 hypothetical protein FVW59_04300 [Parahaliea aestuarii]